jgi:LytS/YehU family sensor histidine kinase
MQHLLHFHLPICLFTVMAAHAYAYFRRYQEKERKAVELAAGLAEARLLALQMQLQPHFLFNALNAMSALVHTNPQAADDMITNLSELLRRSLNAGRQREVPLGEELSYVQCYLEIERVRFGSRLTVEWQIADDARAAQVPVLCLQAIVENAIRHGIERRQQDVGRVRIAAERAGDLLRVTVTDNGPGVAPGETRPRGHGVGLGNTRSRLATLHGEAAAVRLENVPAGGCRAVVTLPFRLTPAASLTLPPFPSSPHENQSPHR